MQKVYYLISIFLAIIFMVGCGPRQLNSNANNVYLYSAIPSKKCQYIGKIENGNVHSDMNFASSIQDLKTDEINFLKNEGTRLGANVVVFGSHNSVKTTLRVQSKVPYYITYNQHQIRAIAYVCPLILKHTLKQDENINFNEKQMI